MLNAFASLKFSKKCWHDAQEPHWNWPISWEKYPKIDRSVKVNVVALAYYGSCRLLRGIELLLKTNSAESEKSSHLILCLFGFVKATKFRDSSEFSECVQNVLAKSCLPGQCLQLFRGRLSNKRGKAYATMSKYTD